MSKCISTVHGLTSQNQEYILKWTMVIFSIVESLSLIWWHTYVTHILSIHRFHQRCKFATEVGLVNQGCLWNPINRTWSCYVAWKSFNFFMDLVMLRWCNILGLTNDNSGCWRCNSLFTALIMKHCSLILSALLWFCLWLLTITIILCAAARSYCVSASSGVTLKLPSLKHFMV